MYGIVESMKVQIGFDRSNTAEPFAYVAVIDCRPTIRSRETSGAREKETLLGTSRDES